MCRLGCEVVKCPVIFEVKSPVVNLVQICVVKYSEIENCAFEGNRGRPRSWDPSVTWRLKRGRSRS